MGHERQVYLLDPKKLSPETIAVTFAKTSRSPQSFREIAAELTDESSAQFNEKWVVGYGHSSVAEHAVVHVAIENISRLAVETIESNRLASYTEKSTRYQKWDPEAFFVPSELHGHPLLADYISVCRLLFSTYERAINAIHELVRSEEPRRENESQPAWERRIRTQYIDVCRYLLPACSLANVGLTANARVLEHAIQKMLTSPLNEVRGIGGEVKHVATEEIPTLIKYADAVPSLEQAARDLSAWNQGLAESQPNGWCHLVGWDPQGEDRILAAALFRYGQADFNTCLAYVSNLDSTSRLELARAVSGNLSEHDVPIRELEHSDYTFDVLMDQGAYFEVKRHRMATQTPQNLTSHLGFAVPRRITAAGFESLYQDAMEAACQLYDRLLAAFDPYLAGYIVPNGFNRRVLITMNLREAFHFCSLRSSPTAHFAVRRVALRLAEEIFNHHPALAAYMQLPAGETWQSITAKNFSSV